ncbi:MAG: hypothetical protein H7641_03665, partial [Candidatus Heimdallarchaeota archaeon]|nr:hypothetical protein [Candidatus Heimdallarchaeota archaeon]MCK4876660.1 hypothetical protein [Candidatus Heimdallarchaeota archaeon]
GADTYIVEGNMMNYETNDSYVTIDFDGEGEYLELYLQPIVHEINILSPSDSDTIEGGVVYVICEANDEYNLDYIEVYVNAISITTFDVSGGGGFQSEFFVPVFGNGTNTIQIDAHWLDMTTDSDSIDVNSINVIPIVKVKVGDIMNYRYEELATTNGADYNFTFTGWLSPFEINTHVALRTYDHTGTLMFMEYFIHVNVLNGYVPTDPTGQFYEMHFFPFSNLLPNPQVGDLYIMTPWWSMITVTGSMLWEYTDVWTLGVGTLELYIEKSSNIVYYYGEPGSVSVTLIETTIDFLNPDLSDEVNLDYDEGDTGNSISWDATDMNPDSYIIYRDSVEVDTGAWDSVTPIVIDVDGLTDGSYVYLIVVTDLAGNTAQDTVTVTVNPVVPEFGSHYFVFLPILILTTYLIVSKRKKKNK